MTAAILPMPETPMAPLANIEAEMALMGAILLNNDALDRIAGLVAAEDFAEPLHARLFEVFATVREAGSGVTPALIQGHFTDDERFEEVGGVAYLGKLMGGASLFNVVDYAKAIRDLAQRRDIVSLCQTTMDEAHKLDVYAGARDIATEHLSALHEVVAVSDRTIVGYEAAAAKAIEREARAMAGEDEYAGAMPTGLADLDRIIRGLPDSEISVLAARPAMGKTALALSIAVTAAMTGRAVLFFSLEMDETQLMSRILSIRTGTSADDAARGNLTEIDFETRRTMAGSPLPIIIDPTSDMTAASIAGRARSVARRHKDLGLVVVDHLALLRPVNPRSNQPKVYEVAENTMLLKALAKELEAPVLVLHQLNRAVENRDDKRPGLADLRDSGSVEQDAAVVMFLYREEEYHRRSEPEDSNSGEWIEWGAKLDKIRGKALVTVAKNRFGPSNRRVDLQFDAESTAFRNLAR